MKIRIKPHIQRHTPVTHGGLDSTKNTDPRIVDFSSNIAPLLAPKSVRDAIRKNLNSIQVYPDLASSRVISNLKKYTHLPESNLLVGNGAVEIIYNFCNAFLSKDTPILITVPTFAEYETAAKLNDCKITFFKTMNLSDNVDSFICMIPKNGCVFICNPNNPTGRILQKKHMLAIIQAAKKLNCLVFVDECFIELVPSSDESVISFIKKYDNLFVLRSLTKSFAIPGLRIGYAAGNKQMIGILNKIKIPWSVNSLAQNAAIAALQHKSYLAQSKLVIKKELKYLKDTFDELDGLKYYDSSTNFILIKTKHNSTKLQQKLLWHKILVRDCKNFRGLDNNHIRIAVKSHKENLKLVRALEQVL